MISIQKIVSFLIFSITASAQDITEIENSYNSEVGIQNSYLFNGKIYTNQYRFKSKNNQYFNQLYDYSKGNVTINNILFENLDLKYDVYTEELIIKPDSKTTFLGIIIDTTKLESFHLQGKKFLNIQNQKESEFNGFFEVGFESDRFSLLIKHKKRKIQKLDENAIYYEFENNFEYVIRNEDDFYSVTSKKDFQKIFPKYKNEIKSFYDNNAILKKENMFEFMKKIALFIETLKVPNEK